MTDPAVLARCTHDGTTQRFVGAELRWCRVCGAIRIPFAGGKWFRPEGLAAFGPAPRLSAKARACLRWILEPAADALLPTLEDAIARFGADVVLELVTADVVDVDHARPQRLISKPPPPAPPAT